MEKNYITRQRNKINYGLRELASIYASKDNYSLSNAEIRLAELNLSQEKSQSADDIAAFN